MLGPGYVGTCQQAQHTEPQHAGAMCSGLLCTHLQALAGVMPEHDVVGACILGGPGDVFGALAVGGDPPAVPFLYKPPHLVQVPQALVLHVQLCRTGQGEGRQAN